MRDIFRNEESRWIVQRRPATALGRCGLLSDCRDEAVRALDGKRNGSFSFFFNHARQNAISVHDGPIRMDIERHGKGKAKANIEYKRLLLTVTQSKKPMVLMTG